MGRQRSDNGDNGGVIINAFGKFQCRRCPSSFKRAEHLKRHERCHDDLKRFPCLVCEKRFTRRCVCVCYSYLGLEFVTLIHRSPK